MKYSKAVEIMMQLKAEYFYAFKDMPDELFKIKVKNFMNSLEGYTDKEIDVALGFVLKESKTLPTTAHFIEVLERNRDMLLPSAEEEWVKISEVVKNMSSNSKNFDTSYGDWDKHREKQKSLYLTLSNDVKEYYINYSGFLDLLEVKNLEIAKAQFLKAFPEWRRLKKKKEQLLEKGGECKNGTEISNTNKGVSS